MRCVGEDWIYLVIVGGMGVAFFVLLVALLWGQPAAQDQAFQQVHADATVIAALRTEVAERPLPTRVPRLCPGYVQC